MGFELRRNTSSIIKGSVEFYADLSSIVNPAINDYYLVRKGSGIPYVNRKSSGLYYWNGTDWVDDDKDIINKISTLESTILANSSDISSHVSNQNNPHNVTKEQIGLGNVPNTPHPVDSVNGVTGAVSLRNFDITQWVTTMGSGVSVPNGQVFNILQQVLSSEKTPVSATNSGQLDVILTPFLEEDYIKPNWLGTKEMIYIRVIMDIVQGGTDYFRLILRRKSDNSIISVHPLTINNNDVPENIMTCNILTYIGSSTDSFITGGFYIQFANNSGQSITLINNINILIKRNYQQSLNNN